jgi:DnaJ-class molecular chaperone
MACSSMTITISGSDGREYTHEWPAKFAVCDDCEGHGTVLTESIRQHAYSREEFEEAFDDDESREAYFKRGGMFDVPCPTCKGNRVVREVDKERVSFMRHGKKLLELWEKSEWARLEDEAAYRAECEMERRMGC